MPTQQFSKLNFLSTTERRFYTRKKPSYDQFHHEQSITKAVNVLNSSSKITKIGKYKLRTQIDQKTSQYTQSFYKSQFVKKQIRAKIQLLLLKSDKKWKNLFQSYEDLKTCSNSEQFSIQENKFYIAFTELLKQSSQQIKSALRMKKTQIYQNRENKKEQNDLKINLEKIKLMKENEMLRKKCFQSSKDNNQRDYQFHEITNAIVQQKSNKQTVQQSESILMLKLKIKQLNFKICQLQNENHSLKENLVISENALNNMSHDKDQLAKKNEELRIKHENLCSKFLTLKLEDENSNLKIDRWKSIISFQRQEIYSYESELISIKNQYKALMQKYKILVKKLNSITNTNNQPVSVSTGFRLIKQFQNQNFKYLEIFREQLETFTKVRGFFNNKESQNTLDKSNSLNEKKKNSAIPNADTYKNFMNQKQSLSNTTAVKKLNRQHYAYFKPNFYNFVQNYFEIHAIDRTNMEQLGGGFDLNCQFLTTIRAIFDCKFNDFLNQDFTKSSSLATFTYGWLCKYKIHRKKKKIIPIKGDMDQNVIPNFFMNLMSQKLNSNWQIITFREFLMETLTLDELYFYLMARNCIFQGGLLENISGIYQEIYHISMTEVFNILPKFIPDANFRKKIQEYLRRFIFYVRKRPLIDVHFVLRILLEYYQSKKHQEFTNLASLAELLSKEKVPTFSFQSFLKIFQYNFTYLSITQKLQIYKKSFSCSRGKINLQTILTVLTEEGYLCKQVKKIFCNDQITVIKDQKKANNQSIAFELDLPDMMKFEEFFQNFVKSSYEQIRLVMGLQIFDKKMDLVKQFNQTNIFQRIELIFKTCLWTMRKSFYTKKIGLEVFLPILGETVEILRRLSKITCQKNSIIDLMTNLKRDTAAIKILRFYRNRRNHMHRNYIFGVKDQVIEQNHKMEGLRNQFKFMIKNLKHRLSQKKISQEEVQE